MYRRNGTPSDCFVIDVGDIKRTKHNLKHNLMLQTGQRIHLQSLLAVFESINLTLVQN